MILGASNYAITLIIIISLECIIWYVKYPTMFKLLIIFPNKYISPTYYSISNIYIC